MTELNEMELIIGKLATLTPPCQRRVCSQCGKKETVCGTLNTDPTYEDIIEKNQSCKKKDKEKEQ